MLMDFPFLNQMTVIGIMNLFTKFICLNYLKIE